MRWMPASGCDVILKPALNVPFILIRPFIRLGNRSWQVGPTIGLHR